MEADAYPDSSFLVSLHLADSFHETACAFMARAGFTLVFTPLHRIEVRNALRNAMSSGDLKATDRALAFRQIEEDLRDGLLIHTSVNWTDAYRRADELSEKHATTEGQRALDLLHVAIALESGTKTFLSFDRRQRKLAKAAGLKVKP